MTKKHERLAAEITAVLLLVAISFLVTSCSRSSAGAGEPAAPEVEVATVQQKGIPVYREWIGTLDGMVNAAIRAQVTGYLLTQDYSEGSFVRKGQLLFQIDPRRFRPLRIRRGDNSPRRMDSWHRLRPNISNPKHNSRVPK